MTYDTLISVERLSTALGQTPPPMVIDCGFELANPDAGRLAFEAGHIPTATYVHLELTLSAQKTGRNGRHPLPDRDHFARHMASLGAGEDTQLVAYDNAGGMYASRLWWMMRWLGHRAVAVLDGGLAAWILAGHPLSVEPALPRAAQPVSRKPSLVETVSYEALATRLDNGRTLVLDARGADRFRGENETIDPVAGHIPGAVNRPFKDNLGADGLFKRPAQLRAEFDSLTGGRPAGQWVSQCGSGVTACHNLLAMEIAGLQGAVLYPGSWSEWCAQPGAPVATGPDPGQKPA